MPIDSDPHSFTLHPPQLDSSYDRVIPFLSASLFWYFRSFTF